jgi:hypothetical protein
MSKLEKFSFFFCTNECASHPVEIVHWNVSVPSGHFINIPLHQSFFPSQMGNCQFYQYLKIAEYLRRFFMQFYQYLKIAMCVHLYEYFNAKQSHELLLKIVMFA